MRVVVDLDNIGEAIARLSHIQKGIIALDTETYGLKWNDDMFSLQLSVQDGDSYYFNFHQYPLEQNAPVLNRTVLAMLHNLWRNDRIRWVMANAKFDLRRLDINSVYLAGEVYDVLLMAKIQYNKYFQYGLDACLKRIGREKDDTVSLYVKDHKCYTMVKVEGKKTKEKDLHFEQVPFNLIVPYGLQDVEETLRLYEHQEEYFTHPDNKEQLNLIYSNIELTKTVYDMERTGIKLNLEYCHNQLALENELAKIKYDRIEELSNKKFKGGPKWLKEVFNEQGIELSFSEKGNVVLDKQALKAIPNAIASYVLEIRDHEKRASTYSTLIRFADREGILHTNYRLNGTDTLRFSSNDPNLQNIEACEKGNLSTVRTAFVPREDFIFVSIDYKTMEYRLCADIAGEQSWIEAINNGADPHQFVADLMGVDRKSAKTLNFMLLYGGGLAKLALALFPIKTDEDTLTSIVKVHIYGNSKNIALMDHERCIKLSADVLEHEIEQLRKADVLKKKYFESLPSVAKLTKDIQSVGVSRGYVKNQFGMRYFLGEDARFSYRLPNHLIQGTGACIIRSAMNKIAYQLEGMKSKMLLQIHDELLLEIHKDETHLVTAIKDIMENEYKPMNGMLLKCDVEYSTESWNANTFKQWSEYGY